MNLSFFNSCRFNVKVDTTCVTLDFPSLQSAYEFCNWIMMYDDKVNLCSIELVYVDNESGYNHHIIDNWFYSRKDHEAKYNKYREEIKKEVEEYYMRDQIFLMRLK